MQVIAANSSHIKYAQVICDTIEESAKQRGTGIAKRTPEYIITKMENQNAIIALDGDKFAGFCYIEIWEDGKFVAHSGLIVAPEYRGKGLAKTIKKKIFDYGKQKFPKAKIIGITTGLAVMKINYELGYKPVTFSELTVDPTFWDGCQTCVNYDVLTRTERKMCLCTGMLHDPNEKKKKEEKKDTHKYSKKTFKRLKSIKESLFLKKDKNKKK